MPVAMGSKIICLIIIYSMLNQVAFGCLYDESNCTLQVYCYGDVYISLNKVYNNVGMRHCVTSNYNGYNLIPFHVFFAGSINVYEKVPKYDDSIILEAIITLDITNCHLKITPTLNEMDNLKMLNLSNNNLSVADLFNVAELIKLQDIDLSYNIITSIQVDDSQFVYKNLRKINLSHNTLNEIPGGVFDSFKYLEFLDLSYNKIAVIDHYTFEGLKSLKYLCMSHNGIIDLNSSLFRFVYLEKLYLDNNKIENILSRDFQTLDQLQELYLDFNKISRIERDTFNSTVSLTTVKLHHNLLNYINRDAFMSTNKLKAIDISNNLLKTLPRDLFKNKTISSFTITGNNLEGALSRGIFEGIHVTELDISFQGITAVENYAFFGLEQLTVLLLNNNKIHTISKSAFNTLKYLNHLDLSNNFITNIDFDTTDLLSLQTYSLGRNFIKEIHHDHFVFQRLQFLDLSHNNISKLEPNSFTSAETIKNLQILHNPLNGILLTNTFDGLSLIPVLDLSCSLLTKIQNGSFSGMVQIQDLNISRSLINELEYNAFMNTGNLKLLDLSYNKLTEFSVNTSDIRNLTNILLNNNNLIYISNDCFKDMILLNKVLMSHNYLKDLDNETFANQIDLNYLDVSYNSNLTFHISVISNLKNLDKLILSSTKSEIDFTNIGNVTLKYLEMSHFYMYSMSQVHLNKMKYLTDLVLTNDNIVKIEVNDFRNLSILERLDLSFNNISFIQPGSFKDNILLYKLNLSRNFITTLNYGIFRGLVSLQMLDVSFNSIRDLKRERFYDLPNLNTLLIDNNKITDVDNDFFDINLRLLSVGNNPLPCEKIVHMKKIQEPNTVISAINIDEHNGDNIDGIICNMNDNVRKEKGNNTNKFKDDDTILIGIKEILQNLSTTNQENKLPADSRISNLLKNILDKIGNYHSDQIREEIQLKNISSQLSHLTQVTGEVDRTNSILERILKAVLGFGFLQSKSVGFSTNNVTENKNNVTFPDNNSKLNDLITDITQVKHELLYLENAISEIDRKITVDKTINKPLVLDKVNVSDITVDRTERSFVFVEVCVSLILAILVCFILYKIYLSKMFLLKSRSLSTRHITDSIDNSNL